MYKEPLLYLTPYHLIFPTALERACGRALSNNDLYDTRPENDKDIVQIK